ncbi:MAG: M3 family oligoendopeptidase [Clostridia bacterium]|nr:M3 family oligoendopeptidase [Clostridia bacterium]
MMKVSELPYERYTIEQAREQADAIMRQIADAKSGEDLAQARLAFLKLSESVETAYSLANCRFTLNTRDPFYSAEMDYYDATIPLFTQLQNRYEKAMLDSPQRAAAEGLIPARVFAGFELSQKTFSDAVIDDLAAENALVTKYSRFMGDLLFDFDGEKMPLSVLRGKLEDTDRDVRRRAAEAIGRGLEAHSETFDDIYDSLVKIRTQIAQKLGYENYIPLGYARMGRIDYDAQMVAAFRESVRTQLVPVVAQLKEAIRQTFGWERVMFYDNEINVEGRTPAPVIDTPEIFRQAQQMYDAMRPEIGDFMRRMREAEAFDVEAREGKWGGGYCTTFPLYKQPFILANFNGSASDIDTITHEFGHALAADVAFKADTKSDLPLGMETCECHSMSMEFFCHPFMERFFGARSDAYCVKHTIDALSFIPYGVIVDEFQHRVYEKPDMTPEERKTVYRSLEKTYRPYLSYEGIAYLDQGTRWQYQMHIFESPFYYIDYCLAQCVALGFYALSLHDYEDALARYLQFLRDSGSIGFEELTRRAGLGSPFAPGSLDRIIADCKAILGLA